MSDQRDDGQPEPPEEPTPDADTTEPESTSEDAAAPDADVSADTGSDEAEPLEIAEMSPPPPPPSADEPTAVDHDPVAPPPPAAVPLATAPPAPDATVVDAPLESEKQPWPGSAKAVVAFLVVLTLAGIAGTIFGLTSASSNQDDADELAVELADARDRIVALEDQLATLGDETGSMTERLEQLMAERDAALVERDAAVAERDQAAAVAEAERTTLEDEIAELEATLEAVVDEIETLFPLPVSVDLGDADVAGNYGITFTEIACEGLDLCGSPPAGTTATLSSNGGLFLAVPDLFELQLPVVDGTAFGTVQADDLVGPCGDTPRPAQLTMTLFDDDVEIGADGAVDVETLGASVFIVAPAFNECGPGQVWYRGALTQG